jgi:Spy/CpxP family protein refolding chaperone
LVAEVEPILDENQRWTLEESSERTLRRAEMGQRGIDTRLLIERLPEELELTPEQRTRYEELVRARREGMRERVGPDDDRRRLFSELRAAREAGDQERIAQLEAELEELRPPPGERRPAGPDDFFAQLEPILTEQQKAKLATLRPQPAPSFTSISAVLRAANRVDLNREQRAAVKRLGREAQVASGQAGKTRAQEHAEIANKLKRDILDLLTAEQKTKFDQELQRLSRPRGDQRARGERGPGRGSEPPPMRPTEPASPPSEGGAE